LVQGLLSLRRAVRGVISLRREDQVVAALLREVTRYDIGWYFYQVKFKRLPIM
jgi:hypothetical protein